MSPPDPTLFWSRRPAVSACREGDQLILFDPDAGREKAVNWAGSSIWEAMDGTARIDDLAAALARRCEIPPTDEIRADARAFAGLAYRIVDIGTEAFFSNLIIDEVTSAGPSEE